MIAVVVGMASEAALIGQRPDCIVIIGAGNALALSTQLESIIAGGKITAVLSFGICGGIAPDIVVGELAICATVSNGVSKIDSDTNWTNRLLRAFPAAQWARFAWSNTAVA